jgi:hypothetical protein
MVVSKEGQQGYAKRRHRAREHQAGRGVLWDNRGFFIIANS